MRKKSISVLLWVAVSLLGNHAIGQKTEYYRKPEATYRDALDLYSREKFGAARVAFEETASYLSNPYNEIRISAAYYEAACALELFHQDAESSLLRFMQQFPGNSNVRLIYFQIGKYYFWRRNYKRAAEGFDKVVASDLTEDEKAELSFKAGYSHFARNNHEDAKKYFYQILNTDNKYQDFVNYYYAHIAYLEKNYETALQGFQKLKGSEIFSPIIPYYISQIYFLQEKYDELIAYAPPLLFKPGLLKEAEIARIIGEAHYRSGQFSEAIRYLETFKEKSAGSPTREDLYQLGYAYYRSGDCEKAKEHFEIISEGEDELAQTAFYHLGDCFLKLGNKNMSLKAFRAASMLDFSKYIKEDSHYNYAKLAFDLSYNPYNEAVNAIQSYIENYPNSNRVPELYEYLSEIFLTGKNYKDALKSIENADLSNARLKLAYQKITYFRGVELFNSGTRSYHEAIALFNKSLQHRMDKNIMANAQYWKAEAYYRLNNMDSAITAYQAFLFSPGAIFTPHYNLANYNLGYSFFKKEDYRSATSWFRMYLRNPQDEPANIVSDAQIRLGDAYYMMRSFPEAIMYYSLGAESKYEDADYALFQRGMANGLSAKYSNKVNDMLKLISDFPKSRYLPDAKFEAGKTYQALNQEDMAIRYYEKVVSEHPNSSYVKNAMLRKGLILYAQEKNEDALATFKKVVEKYPSTEESKEALMSIRNIYVSLNDVESFFVYVKGINFTEVSVSAQDSLSYQAVENIYMKGDCAESIKGFGNYLSKFPQAIFALNANYYKAECDLKFGNKDDALKGFEFVIANSNDRFLENALVKASELYFTQNRFKEAYTTYEKLEKRAQFPKNTTEARKGLMRSAYLMGDYADAIGRSRIVLETEKIDIVLREEALITIGRSALEIDSIALAKEYFQKVINSTKSEASAEARYRLAGVLYKQKHHDETEKAIFDLINQIPSYDYWVARGFILLADNYLAKDDLFQAKHTLRSIIDNYDGNDEVIRLAQANLEKILEKEREAELLKARERMERTSEDIRWVEEFDEEFPSLERGTLNNSPPIVRPEIDDVIIKEENPEEENNNQENQPENE